MSPTISDLPSPRVRAGLLGLVLLLGSACSELDESADPLTRLTTMASHTGEAPRSLVARVYYRDRADLNALATDYDALEKVDRQAGFVVLLLTPEAATELRERGYRVELDEASTASVNAPRLQREAQPLGIPSYACYRTVEESYTAMAQLAANRPEIASWVDIGDSWDKFTRLGPPGYDLYALVLTNKAKPGPKPRFFLMAAIHAREYTTAETATRFAETLVSGYGNDADITWMLDYGEVHIVVQSNPDGRKIAEQGLTQRKNRNTTSGNEPCSNPPNNSSQFGVDLNRNSTFGWGGPGASTGTCNLTYRGRSAASEPETSALENYIRSLYPDRRGPGRGDAAPDDTQGVMISLHSYSELVLFPWGDSGTTVPNLAGLRALGRRMSFYNGYEACQTAVCLYEASGATDDFAYGELGVASYTIELGTDFFESCNLFESNVYPRNLPALLYAFKVARRPYQLASGPDSRSIALTPATIVQGMTATLRAVADDTRFGSVGGTEPTQSITAARYSVDAPSWVPNTPVYALAAADGAFSSTQEQLVATLDTRSLAAGRHTLFVESRDSTGAWGPPTAVFFTVQAPFRQVGVSPGASRTQGLRGQLIAYSVGVTNQGNVADSFKVSTSANWPFWSQDSVGPLAAGQSTTFLVTVLVPEDAPLWSTDTTRVHITSVGDPQKTATASIVTMAMSPGLPSPSFTAEDTAQ
jgi:hypothetical protein